MRGLAPRHGEDGVASIIFASQRDSDLGAPYLDVADLGSDQLGVIDGGIGSEVPADRIDNGGLDLGGGHAGDGAGGLRPSLDQGRGDVVAVPCRALAAVAGAHAVAAVIKDAPSQQSLGVYAGRAMAV